MTIRSVKLLVSPITLDTPGGVAMNKMSQDKMFVIILVSVFAAAATFLGALTMSGIGAKHGEGGHGAPTAAAAGAVAEPAGEHH